MTFHGGGGDGDERPAGWLFFIDQGACCNGHGWRVLKDGIDINDCKEQAEEK